jgi:hypothetical protein
VKRYTCVEPGTERAIRRRAYVAIQGVVKEMSRMPRTRAIGAQLVHPIRHKDSDGFVSRIMRQKEQ